MTSASVKRRLQGFVERARKHITPDEAKELMDEINAFHKEHKGEIDPHDNPWAESGYGESLAMLMLALDHK